MLKFVGTPTECGQESQVAIRPECIVAVYANDDGVWIESVSGSQTKIRDYTGTEVVEAWYWLLTDAHRRCSSENLDERIQQLVR